MPKIIDTQQITSDKSTFIIDIVKSDSGKLYVEVSQSINATREKLPVAKLDPNVLTDLIASLQYCHSIINVVAPLDNKHLDEVQSAKIQSLYFKNIPIKTIAQQLDISERLIIDSLRKSGVELVDLKPPKRRFYRNRK